MGLETVYAGVWFVIAGDTSADGRLSEYRGHNCVILFTVRKMVLSLTVVPDLDAEYQTNN